MSKSTTVGQRFSQLIQALGMSKNAFALSLDKTATVIQHIVEERNKPGFDLLCKVFEVYPNISKDWLLQGDGSMFPFGGAEAVGASLNHEPLVAAPVMAREPVAQAAPLQPEAPASVPAAAPVHLPVPEPPAVPLPEAALVAPISAAAPPPVAAGVPPTPAANWEAMLYAQQLQHQLALAEQRNQHLLEQQKMLVEQQRMMQQMMEMLRPAR